MDRRTFLRWVAGAGASGAGLGFAQRVGDPQPMPADSKALRAAPSVVRHPDRWLSPVQEEPHVRPGIWTMFATTCRECPAGCGMHVRTREGRVVKPEGNPDHPVSRGGLCPRGQSAPQGLYDPDRVRRPLFGVPPSGGKDRSDPRKRGTPNESHRPLSWSQALAEVTAALKNAKRLFIVSDLQTGSLAEILRQFHRAVGLPGAVAFYEAFDYEALRSAHEQLLGRAVIPRYRLQDCDFILSFGAEFLETWVSNVEWAWQFAQMHHRAIADFGLRIADSNRDGVANPHSGELACIEPRLSMTAANADHFLQVPAGQEYAAARAILQEVVRLKGLALADFGLPFGVPPSSGSGSLPAQPAPYRVQEGQEEVRTVNPPEGGTPNRNAQFIEIARQLASARNAVVLPGPAAARGPAAERLATVAMQLNQALGALGRTVDFSQTHALGSTTPVAQIEEMIRSLGPDDVLIVHQTNPAYSLPHLRESLGRAGHLLYLGELMNETARMARWVLPVHSPLEAWGDYEPWTGVHCLMQPAMGALHDTRHSGDVFLSLAAGYGRPLQKAGEQPTSFYDWLRLDWRRLHQRVARGTDFEAFWRQALQRGGFFEAPSSMGVPPMPTGGTPVIHMGRMPMLRQSETPARPAMADLGRDAVANPLPAFAGMTPLPAQGRKVTPAQAGAAIRNPQSQEPVHLWLWPSIKLFDGRLANRGWMQEVSERMSTVAWGSWIDISPALAQRLEIREGDAVEVSNGSGRVTAPARITEDVADNVAALAFGQGHTGLGETADGRGVNAFLLRMRPDQDSLFGAVTLRKTGARMPLISLSATQDQHGREILRWTTPRQLGSQEGDGASGARDERKSQRPEGRGAREERSPAPRPPGPAPLPPPVPQVSSPSSPLAPEEIVWPGPRGYDPHRDLYAPHEYKDHRWAMVADLDRCIGCGACEVACYAENNIPVMGPGPVAKGREMSWLRIPPYRDPDERRRVGFLPLPCQHCDAAPCEPVCPVFAAVHNEQGLNAQIYNRCIGTRYCSNNCPYKVRRFGWFDPHWREPLHLQLNPEVTVRSRGVMEKCTFCIQRIYYHERQAKVEGRPLRDGEIQPACVQSCPTRTYTFGDLMDPNSRVSKLFDHPRRYQLLKELNTKPAVVYLKRIKPDHTELEV